MAAEANPGPRPRRLLSIDGGGLAGLIPAESLIRIEEQLNQMTGEVRPLCERFDLIGGTSTGAILAAGLAMGFRAAELRDFYLEYGAEIFTKTWPGIRFWHKYPSGPLEKRLREKFGETTLGSSKLRTNVLIVTKNATLGNDWFFTNNPQGKYFKTNASLPLWQIVRASSAAPTYFPPEPISIPDRQGGQKSYEFIDGGVSSYNNPSFQVFLEATTPEYGFGWDTGVDKLLMISLGTGFSQVTIAEGRAVRYNLVCWGIYAVQELMADANLQQNVLLHLIGDRPARIRSATAEVTSIGSTGGTPSESALDKVRDSLGGQKQLTYQRITVLLTRERLDELGLKDIDPVKVRKMDAVDQIQNLQRLGEAVAQQQVKMQEFKGFF